MKNYFDFRVKGLQLLAVCIGYLVCCAGIVGYLGVLSVRHTEAVMASASAGAPLLDSGYYLVVGLLSLVYTAASILLSFFFVRICVDGLAYRGEPVQTDYNLGRYCWLVVKGGLLSMITLGVYYPWFITRLVHFFTDNATYAGKPLQFKGLGSTLFCLMTFVLLMPYLLFGWLLSFTSGVAVATGSAFFLIVAPLCGVAIMLLLALYLSLEYRWFIDFAYGESRIRLKSGVVVGMLFIFIQFTLSLLTLGLYLPVAGVMIYRFLVENMVLVSEQEQELELGHFGYNGHFGRDCLYVFAQYLLMLITLGIYLPWMMARIGRRLVSRTYLERPDASGSVPGASGVNGSHGDADQGMAVPIA